MRFNTTLLTMNLKAWHGIKRTFPSYQLWTTILKSMLCSLKYLIEEEDRKGTSINSHKFCTSLSSKVTRAITKANFNLWSLIYQLLLYSEKKERLLRRVSQSSEPATWEASHSSLITEGTYRKISPHRLKFVFLIIHLPTHQLLSKNLNKLFLSQA